MNMKRILYTIILLLGTVFISGCTTIAGKAGMSQEYVKAGDFQLVTYQRFNKLSDKISIYIEGDGRAWETKHKLSQDPTPSNPVALRLAAVDPADNVAYIARPGQYSPSGLPECDSQYWSGRRFAPEVVDAFDRAIDILKEKAGAQYVELTGYSGGGAIAVLVAAKRRDVIALRTVAGNLDTKAFCAYHHVSPLEGSLNPMDVAPKTAHIPQHHFIGSKDKIIPFAIAGSFVKMEGDKDDWRVTMVDGPSHNHGWEKRWKELLSMPCL